MLSCSSGHPKQLWPEMDWHPRDEKLGSTAAPGPPRVGWLGGELASNARFPRLERGSGWVGAA